MHKITRQTHSLKTYFIGVALTALLLAGCSADDGRTNVGGGTGGPAPVITFTATPSTVPAGGTTTLTHTTTGATSCVASGAWSGNRGTSGSTVVTVPATAGSYTYTLTCTGSNGQQSAQSVTVTVTGGGGGGGGGGGNTGPITGGAPGSVLPNDGTVPTEITEGGTDLPGNFRCTTSALAYGPNPVTLVTVNGLVGATVTDLLNMLGAGTVTQLLNSVVAKELVVDGNLDTFATFNQTAGLLDPAIESIDLYVGLNAPAPAGKFAVFGVTFPIGTLELSVMQTVTVTTFSGTTAQESITYDANALNLLGQNLVGDTPLFLGVKATQAFDGVTISLTPAVLTANVGKAMNVHELCTDGLLVAP